MPPQDKALFENCDLILTGPPLPVQNSETPRRSRLSTPRVALHGRHDQPLVGPLAGLVEINAFRVFVVGDGAADTIPQLPLVRVVIVRYYGANEVTVAKTTAKGAAPT